MVRHFFYTSIQMVKLPVEDNVRLSSNYPLPCVGDDAWRVHRPAGWGAFLRQFLPGLFAVFLGRISFVGLPPKSAEEIQQLPLEWRAIYQKGRAGLITEACVAATDTEDETQRYLADAYYAAKQNWLHDLKLASQYIVRLIVPAL